MGALTTKGISLAGLIWLALLFLLAQDAACLNTTCGRGDLVLFAVCGAGMLIPAYFATAIIGKVFPALLTRTK